MIFKELMRWIKSVLHYRKSHNSDLMLTALNIKEFATDLMDSIPAIETAIMGGTVGQGSTSGTQIKGLASAMLTLIQQHQELVN